MVARTTVTIYDDLDNTEGASTVSFAYRGTSYEIDLGEKNQAALDKALAKFIAVARKKDGRPSSLSSRGRPNARTKGRTDLTAIRVWAQEQGFQVSDRGRIPGEVQGHTTPHTDSGCRALHGADRGPSGRCAPCWGSVTFW